MNDRNRLVRTALVVIVVAALVLLILALYFSQSGIWRPPHGGPDIEMTVRSRPEGYRIEIVSVSELWDLDSFQVLILTEETPWTSFPRVLEVGPLGRGASGEYLNFTDIAYERELSLGDFFTLQGLQSSTEYEIKLIWAQEDVELDSKTILVP